MERRSTSFPLDGDAVRLDVDDVLTALRLTHLWAIYIEFASAINYRRVGDNGGSRSDLLQVTYLAANLKHTSYGGMGLGANIATR